MARSRGALAIAALVAVVGSCDSRATRVESLVLSYDLARDLALAERDGPSPRHSEGRPGADAEAVGDDAVSLPVGLRLDYFLSIAPGSVLVVDALDSERGPIDSVSVELQFDGSDRVRSWQMAASAEAQLVELGHERGGIARVSLQAAAGEGGEGRVRLRRPRILAPPDRANVARVQGRSPSPRFIGERPNVLIYNVDTLRADHLGVYGYPRAVSPRIDSFAAQATVFVSARANSSWTRPAVASILTGLHPWAHGANDTAESLPGEIRTLPEILREAGYQTVGFTTNGNVSGDFGFAQGFDRYVVHPEDLTSERVHVGAERLTEEVDAWLAERDETAAFFLYLHATDPHAPYAAPEPVRRRFAAEVDPEEGSLASFRRRAVRSGIDVAELRTRLVSLYDAEIAWTDLHFGALLDVLTRHGVFDETLIFFTADHGEEFGEHGNWLHGKSLYAEQLRIPLIARLPGGLRGGRRDPRVAEQADIAPTVLDLLALPVPPEVSGRSLFRDREGHDLDRPTVALLDREERYFESIEVGGFKLIHHQSERRPRGSRPVEVFDLTEDPGELSNLAESRPLLARYLGSELRRIARDGAGTARSETVPLDRDTRRKLRELGYLQ